MEGARAGGVLLHHSYPALEAEIKCLPLNVLFRSLGRQEKVCVHDVSDEYEITGVTAIAPQHGSLVRKTTADNAGHKLTPVKITATVNVTAARDCNRQPVALGISKCDQVC